MGCGASKEAVKPASQPVAEEVPKPPSPPAVEQHVHVPSTTAKEPASVQEPAHEPERPVAATVPSTVTYPREFLREGNGQKAAKTMSITEVHHEGVDTVAEWI
jgi:hypothetical protein